MARRSPPAQNADLEFNQTLDSLNFLHFLHFWYTKDWRAMELATPVDSQSKEPFAMDDQSSVSSNITYQETFDERSDIQSSGRLTPRNNLQLKDQRDLYLGERESRTYTKESMTEQQYNSTEASNIEPPRRSDQGKSLNNSALRGSYTSEQASKAYETDSTSQQQYIWTKTSNFDTSGRSPPQRIPYDEGQREHYVSEREASNYDKDGISKQQQVPTETSIVANLMPTPRNTACGRSKSPRPNVSAETKARWAMLKSLAGVSKEEDVPGRETDEEKVDVTSDYEHPHQQLEGWSAENHHNSSHAQGAELETSKDDGLIPLHLGDHSNSASMERYLESLQRNPHIDDRGLQEGLRASKRLSSDYTKVQLNRTRSRGRSSAKDLVPKAMNVLGSDLSANDRNARNSRGEGSDLEHNFRAAGGTLEGDFRKDTRNAEARLHKLGDQDIASGIEHAERDVESVVHFANSELHNLDVRHDIQRGEQNLKEGVGKLEGSQVARDLRRGRHKFNADFGNAERAVESIVPDLHIGQDLRRGEQDLKEGLHKLGDATLGRDFQRGKHEFAIGLKDAETAVESILPNADILQDLQRTERNLEEGVQILEGGRSVQDLKNGTMDLVHDIKGAERVVEQLLPGHDVPQAVRRGEHELGAGIDNMVKSAVNLLPGFHIEREIRKGEHVLQDVLRGEARKVENMLPGLELRRDIKIGERGLTNGLHEGVSLVEQELDKVESVLPGHDARRDISSGERIITNGLHNGIQSADRELRRFEGTSLRKELEGDGRNLDHNLERLGRSVLSQAPKNDQVLDRDARRIGHFAEDVAKGARQFANEGFGIGENATRQAASATPNMRSSNNRDMQDREGTRNRGQFHPQDHKIRPVSSHQAPRSIMAKPGEARPHTQTQQLPPSSFPAGPQGPVSAANETARRPMPAIQNQGRKPVPAHSQPLRSTNARPGHNQTAVRTTQPNDLLVPQQRRSEGSMKDEQFASSQAKTQGDRHQTLSNTQPSQLRQPPGLNPSKAEAPTATPPPHVAPRNIGSRHNQEALKPGHTDKQLVNRAPPQHQAGKAGGYVQQLGQEGPAHIDQRLRNSHAELRNEQQREQRMNSTEHLGDREEVLKQEQNERGGEEAQGALHQDQFPSLEQNPTLRAPHTQDQETTVPDKHEGHTANADSHQRQSNAAVNRPQSIVEPPNAVSGPRQMVNMFKARSDASIEAAGGYPGFVDQMIQLLCTMAQDALPEVERRLAENQRQAGR